MYDLTRFSIIS